MTGIQRVAVAMGILISAAGHTSASADPSEPAGAATRAGSQRPNVLLISIDDLNDWTGCLGGHPQAQTPHIDRLAKRGTLFANAHCQSPVCNPSRASMMTGRYPHTSGVYFLNPDLKQAPVLRDLTTLPEAFAAAGYRTLGAGKIFHTGDKRFFEQYGGNNGGFGPRPQQKISQPHGHPLWDWGVYPATNEQMPDWKASAWAAEQLAQDHERPFFLAVGFYRPHVPMYAPQEWFDRHPREQIQLPLVNDKDREDLSEYAIDLTNREHVSPEHQWVQSAGQWKHSVQSYLASVTFADHCVGRVLDALDHSSHKDNTIVVLFSDHGFHLGEKQRWAKRSLWEDGTRVPLIVSAPGQEPGTCYRPAELIDVYPTLLELAGLPADDRQQGQSLVPLIQNPTASWGHPAITSFGPGNFAVRTTRYRYIQYLDGSREFYDHATDPHEWHNLIDQPELADVIAFHAQRVPQKQRKALGQNSTGHKAYAAANSKL